MIYENAAEEDSEWLHTLIGRLPKDRQDIFLNTPELEYLPLGLFQFTLEQGCYPLS